MQLEISKRKLESYKRAEAVAQELRFQIANNMNSDNEILADLVIKWMRTTGKEKFNRPAT